MPPNPFFSAQSRWKYWLASGFIVLHLAIVFLAASVNHRRSALQDVVLTQLQPYTIGLNLYNEALNVEWISDQSDIESVRVAIETKSASIQETEASERKSTWIPIIELTPWSFPTSSCDQPKKRQLLRLLSTLAAGDDSEGILRILKGIVLHIESVDKRFRPSVGELIVRIRLELPSESQNDLGSERGRELSAEHSEIELREANFFVASVARFDHGEIGLVSRVSPARSVRSKWTEAIP